ncbi:MAG: aminotransferase class V-fold PLP-dependent enzyme [Thermoanaerobaculia bacterium]
MAESERDATRRFSPLDMDPEEFRSIGHQLVDRLADFFGSWPERGVTRGEFPAQIRSVVGTGPLPEEGSPAGPLVEEAARILIDHSLFNGHPRFWGYITSSPAPIGALADLLAAATNANVGSFSLAPVATEIETQTVRWIGELIGFPTDGGLLVSGGNMANFVAFVAARRAKADWDLRAKGPGAGGPLRVYTSRETHTWISKAADLFGLGTDAIRWIDTKADLTMDTDALEARICEDRGRGDQPFLVVGTAGSVSTGAIDPLATIAKICREHAIWFHVDGAYGGFAAALPDAPEELKALREADSIAVDPHKWLYAPLEAGCTLVKDRNVLVDAFSYRPPYYHFGGGEGPDSEEPTNFYELGPQNSRGFRALKVWLGLRQVGRAGYVQMIGDDIRLARVLYDLLAAYPELERFTCTLSIVTFRFVPEGLALQGQERETYLNTLNTELLDRLQKGGEAYLSNAVIRDQYVLRACIVNFRTQVADLEALPELVMRIGGSVRAEMRAAADF